MLVVQLLRKHGFGFLIESTRNPNEPEREKLDWKGFRKILYSAVLATDMSLHFAWITRLKEFGEVMDGGGARVGRQVMKDRKDKEEEDRIMICQTLIKCADISNPVSPVCLSSRISRCQRDGRD
jgi:hypothetical protein